MEKTEIERRTYTGVPIKRGYIVSAVRFGKFPDGHKLECTPVKNLEDYSAGCREHAGCFGHMCRTRDGCVLPPHSFSMRSGPIVTKYLEASMKAFDDDIDGYKRALQETNFSKYGHMRGIMSTPVAGSARLVAVPQVQFPGNVVCMPPELMETTRFCAYEKDANGNHTGFLVERSLVEGDYVILVRPPSLTWMSTQPMRVVQWDRPALGIKPELFTSQHGDFDGDEAHIYPISSNESLWEAKHWVAPRMAKFEQARSKLSDLGIELDPMLLDDNSEFIEHTTLSSKQLASGGFKLTLGNQTRNPDEYSNGMTTRFNDPQTELNFVRESIRGTADIVRQQLPQSTIGEMSRVAKVTSSSFYRTEDGNLCVPTSQGPRVVMDNVGYDPGSPCNRAVMLLCAKAQQSALDSHRVGSRAVKGFDFISDMFTPSADAAYDSGYTTFCILDAGSNPMFDDTPRWLNKLDGGWVSLLNTHQIARVKDDIIGGYSPLVLRHVEEDLRFGVCRTALLTVMKYYGCDVSTDELNDLAACLAFEVETSGSPITTRPGALSRSIGWIEKLLATDYSKLDQLESFDEVPQTSTAAMLTANFSNLVLRHS